MRRYNDLICPTLDLSVLIVASTGWTVPKFGHQWHFNWFKWEQMVMLTAFRAFSELASDWIATFTRVIMFILYTTDLTHCNILYLRYKDLIRLNILQGLHLKKVWICSLSHLSVLTVSFLINISCVLRLFHSHADWFDRLRLVHKRRWGRAPESCRCVFQLIPYNHRAASPRLFLLKQPWSLSRGALGNAAGRCFCSRLSSSAQSSLQPRPPSHPGCSSLQRAVWCSAITDVKNSVIVSRQDWVRVTLLRGFPWLNKPTAVVRLDKPFSKGGEMMSNSEFLQGLNVHRATDASAAENPSAELSLPSKSQPCD